MHLKTKLRLSFWNIQGIIVMIGLSCTMASLTSPVYAWDWSASNDNSESLSTGRPLVKAVSVDARNPASTIVTYRLTGGSTTSCTFYAPGITSGMSIGAKSVGRFTCIFDQRDVAIGTSNITLQYQWADKNASETFTVKRESKSNDANSGYAVGMMDEDTVITLRVGGHVMQEHYSLLTYSIPTIGGSKRIRAGWTYAAITFENGQESGLVGYGESHRYQDNVGIYLSVTMGNGTWPDLLPAGVFHWDKYQEVDTHLTRGSTLEGRCSAAVMYDTPNGLIPTINILGGTLTAPVT